jgi:serine/threonine protein kinase
MQTAIAQLIAGRYRVVKKLGGGGQKTVYLAEDLRLNQRQCALAGMIDSFADIEEQRRAIAGFQREADMLASLRDEHIPQIYDKFSEGQNHYLVMEFVEGATLEDKLHAAGGRLGQLEAIEIGLQIVETLQYLHGLNPPVIYRDMKPGNIMVTTAGKVKLIDFGIARFFQSTRMTTFGTVGYAPKEQYTGMVEPRSDLYALGATLHEALSGRSPIPFDFPPLSRLRSDCSEALSDLLVEALADDINQRIANAYEFRARLLKIKEELSQPHASTKPAAAPGNDDRTIPLRNVPTEPQSATLFPDGTANERTAILSADRTRASQAITATIPDGEANQHVEKQRRRWPRVLILAACTGGLALASFMGVYEWNQIQAQKAAFAHEKAMQQLREQEAEQQRLNDLKRQQELQQQEALREQQLQQQEALRQQELQRQQEALQEQAHRLRRQQAAEARRERERQASGESFARYPNSGFASPGYPNPAYPTPVAAATPSPDLTGAVAAGLSAAFGGPIGSSIGAMLNHHH